MARDIPSDPGERALRSPVLPQSPFPRRIGRRRWPTRTRPYGVHGSRHTRESRRPNKRLQHRVGTPVARAASHRTGLVLFTYGSSGHRVLTPSAGRDTTSRYPSASRSCTGAMRLLGPLLPHLLQRYEALLGEVRLVEASMNRRAMAQSPEGMSSLADVAPCGFGSDTQLDEPVNDGLLAFPVFQLKRAQPPSDVRIGLVEHGLDRGADPEETQPSYDPTR